MSRHARRRRRRRIFQAPACCSSRHIGQQHCLAKHLAIGLLRPWRDMDLALEYAGCFLVENIFEGFAAHATWRRVLDEQVVSACSRPPSSETPLRDLQLRAVEPDEHLPAHEARAGDQRETVEFARAPMRAIRLSSRTPPGGPFPSPSRYGRTSRRRRGKQ